MSAQRWTCRGAELDATALRAGEGIVVQGPSETAQRFVAQAGASGEWLLESEGRTHRALVARSGSSVFVHVDGRTHVFEAVAARHAGASRGGHGPAVAPMTGKVVAVLVALGDAVLAGTALVVLSAMKMQVDVRASAAGIVSRVNVAEGDLVEGGSVLVEVVAGEGSAADAATAEDGADAGALPA